MKMIAALATAAVGASVWGGAQIQDDVLVFDSAETYSVETGQSVKGIDFQCPGTVSGQALTLLAPAKISGAGTVTAPLAGTAGLSVTNRWGADMLNVFASTSKVMAPDARLTAMSRFEARICGAWVGWAEIAATTVKTEWNDAHTEALVQFQIPWAEVRTVGLKLRIWQEGPDVLAQALYAKYTDDLTLRFKDWDDVTRGISDYGAASIDNQSIIVRALFGVGDLELAGPLPTGDQTFAGGHVTIRPTTSLTIDQKMTGRVSELRLLGNKSSLDDTTAPSVTWESSAVSYLTSSKVIVDGITVNVKKLWALPAVYDLVLSNKAQLDASVENAVRGNVNDGLNKVGNSILIGPGCRLTTKANWSTQTGVKLMVDGGELAFGSIQNYVNQLSLANGAQVTGTKFYHGKYAAPCLIETTGGAPCIVKPVMLAVYDATNAKTSTFDLASDLRLQGGLADFVAGMTWTKTGPAVLSIEGNAAGSTPAAGTFTCSEGTVRLGVANALSGISAFVLDGGTLDGADCANALKGLQVTADSTLTVGSGSLTFGDSSALVWTEGVKVNVTAAEQNLPSGKIRFQKANGGTGLTDAQLKAFRLNGRRVIASLDADGWLTLSKPGLVVEVK